MSISIVSEINILLFIGLLYGGLRFFAVEAKLKHTS